MSEILTKVFEALGPWPIVQFSAALLIVFGVLKAMSLGERDRKSGGGETTPRFVNEQNLQSLRSIEDALREQNHLLKHIPPLADVLREQTVLLLRIANYTQRLEQIANENVINPRRLRE